MAASITRHLGPRSPHKKTLFLLIILVRFSLIKKWPGYRRCHFERRRGTAAEASQYCKKDGLFYEFGTISQPQQGKRTDLQEYYELVKAGKTDLELAEHNFACYSRTLKATDRIRSLTQPPRDQSRQVILYVGKPGTGKTRLAYEQHSPLWEVPIGKDLWFDGYYGQKTCLLDEFEGQIPLTQALKLLDNYYVRQVPIKGGFVWFNPDTIIVTSNSHPSVWYNYTERTDKEEALRRRFTEIYCFDSKTHYSGLTEIKLYWPLACDGQAVQDFTGFTRPTNDHNNVNTNNK